MITIDQEDELFRQFDSMSELEIQAFMERFIEYLDKRDIMLLYKTPNEYKMLNYQKGKYKRNRKKAS